MIENGLIQVYTGDSEQFNFAPIGLALRAAGHNFRTLIFSFSRYDLMDEAIIASSFLKPNLVIDHSAIEGRSPGLKGENPEQHVLLASLHRAREAVLSGDFDIVVLNNIHQALAGGAIPLDAVLTLMEEKPPGVELVLSGSGAGEPITERADLVTDMVVSHPESARGKGLDSGNSGITEVVTGRGKGKTTYCLGKAMLLSCKGIHASIVQFIKSPQAYGEVMAIERLPFLEIKSMGEGFLNGNNGHLDTKHKEAAQRAWRALLEKNHADKYGLLVLDEINVAVDYGLIQARRVRELVLQKPENLALLLSGRNAHPEIREAATTVIEMRERKHPFKQGIKARKGIEF